MDAYCYTVDIQLVGWMMPLGKKRMQERKMLDRHVKPKYPLGILYPDGRMRLPDMTVVIPKECEAWSIYKG